MKPSEKKKLVVCGISGKVVKSPAVMKARLEYWLQKQAKQVKPSARP